jgi:hypothetical protein
MMGCNSFVHSCSFPDPFHESKIDIGKTGWFIGRENLKADHMESLVRRCIFLKGVIMVWLLYLILNG